jgi:hypothetical protein
MKKIIASTTIAATLFGGGLVLSQSIAGAQEDQAPPSWVDEALSDLVADGTLTQVQVDAVEEALRDARPEKGPRRAAVGQILEDLGLDPEVVREGLSEGLSLGEIAEANGMSADDVVAALIEAHSERLAEAVEAGRLDAETAAEREAEFAEKAEAIVDGTAEPRFGPRARHHRRHHHSAPSGDAPETEAEGSLF